jgi:hypothetical protein
MFYSHLHRTRKSVNIECSAAAKDQRTGMLGLDNREEKKAQCNVLVSKWEGLWAV